MPIKIITSKISIDELRKLAHERFGDLVKAVVDVKLRIMAVGGELHSDQEAALIQNGSAQSDLWGINLYPDITGDDFIEFDSMINLRPAAGNKSRSVEDAKLREEINKIVYELCSL